MRILYELIFSLNYHKRTIGYEYHGNTLRPVFATDAEDNWYLKDIDLKQAKLYNDNLSISFSNAISRTGLYLYSKEILSQIILPTLTEFVDRPRKVYLAYLHHFLWWGKPFVGKLFGKNKGVWKRGSRFYSLPGFITTPLRYIQSNPSLRRSLNQMLTWKSRS